jgi:hypothetical protein
MLKKGDVAWTDELQAEVWSWRGHVNPAFEREYVELSKDLGACFEKRIEYMGYDSHLRPFFKAGLGRVDAALKPMMQAALDVRDDKKLPKGPLEAETEIALVALEIQPVFAAMPFWIAKEGLEFALRTLVKCHEFWTSGDEHGYGLHGVWIMHDRTREGSHPEYADSAWQLLRALLASADDASYAHMRTVASELWKGAPTVIKAFIASAFTTEPDWAREAAAEVLAQGDAASGWSMALVTVTDIDDAAKLAARTDWEIGQPELLTLLARVGSAAAPVVAAALGSASNNEFRKRYAKLLALIETEEAAAAFVPWISSKAINPIATKYFKRVPDVARRALTPIAKGKTVDGSAAGRTSQAKAIEARGAAIMLASLEKSAR